MELDAALLLIVEQIYAAAADPAAWNVVLKNLTELVGGRHAIIFINRVTDHAAPFVAAYGVSMELALRTGSPEAGKLMAGPWLDIIRADKFVSSAQFFTDEENERDEFYKQYIKPMGGFYSAALQQTLSTHSYNFAICRGRADGAFTPAEIDRLQPLIPYFNAAVSIHHRLQLSEEKSTGFARTLWRLENAVIVVDRSGKPLVINDQARKILDQQDGLKLGPSEALIAQTKPLTDQLKSAIAEIASASVDSERALALQRPSGRLPLALTVASVRRERHRGGSSAAHAVIFLKELDGTLSIDTAALIGAFKLTPREAEIACLLASGSSVNVIAEKLKLTGGTVRFNLKRIFDKTGARHQAALIALVRNFSGK